MGGDDHDSLDPDDRGARLRAAGPASADPAVSNVASEPSHGSSAFPGAVASATAVARIHGISPTVAALKINYYDRQRRLHSGQACRRGRPPAAVFVEVPSVPLSSCGGERGMVELIHPGGARLIVHRGAAGVDELRALVELFLRPRV